MRRVGLILAVVLLGVCLYSCGPFETWKADITIARTDPKGTDNDGYPYATITVENIGDAPAYDVTCIATAIAGSSGMWIGSAIVSFEDGATVNPGETAQGTAVFHPFKFSWEYVFDVSYDLNWKEGTQTSAPTAGAK